MMYACITKDISTKASLIMFDFVDRTFDQVYQNLLFTG